MYRLAKELKTVLETSVAKEYYGEGYGRGVSFLYRHGPTRQFRGATRGKRAERDRPEDYLADPGLVDAVNVALLLEQPLLLICKAGNRQDAAGLKPGLELVGAP